MSDTTSIWQLLATIALLLILAIYSWYRRSLPGALPLMFGCLFTVLVITDPLIDFLAVPPKLKVFWSSFHLAWTAPATTAITCFVVEYAWPGRWLTRRNLALLSIIPLFCVFFFLGLAIVQVSDIGSLPTSFAARVVVVYSLVLTLINLAVFAWLFTHSKQHRWPVLIMAMVAVYMAITAARTILGQNDIALISPLLIWPYLAYAIALFGFRIFDPVSLARQTIVDQLHVGVVILNPQLRIVSLNPAAERILGTTASQTVGQAIIDWLPMVPEAFLLEPGEGELEFHRDSGPERRYYTLAATPLKDFRGLEAGSLVMLREITEQKQAQAKILEQQNALMAMQEREHLARDLHDDLAQTLAFLNVQAQATHELLVARNITLADDHLLRLAAVARQGNAQVRDLIADLRSPTPVGTHFIPQLQTHLEHFSATHGLKTELNTTPCASACVDAFSPHVQTQLFHIIQEALTNIHKHAHATWVSIGLFTENDSVRVVVEDDGVGFVPGTMLSEKEHLGLFIMQKRAEDANALLEIQSAPGQGARVVVQIPGKTDENSAR